MSLDLNVLSRAVVSDNCSVFAANENHGKICVVHDQRIAQTQSLALQSERMPVHVR